MIGNSIAGFLGTGVAPAAPNSYESIATVTVGSGGTSSISFSSIPSTYTHLQIRAFVKAGSGGGSDGQAMIRVGNGSVDTASNYSYHSVYGTGATASANNSGTGQNAWYPYAIPDNSTSAFAVWVVDILDYANTNKYKTIRALAGFDTNNGGSCEVNLSSANWRSTSAINIITWAPSPASWVQYSHFALYGIKGV